jgi:hypothetical protein
MLDSTFRLVVMVEKLDVSKDSCSALLLYNILCDSLMGTMLDCSDIDDMEVFI